MVSEILEAVHHLDTAYAAFYTAMTTKPDMDTVHVRQGSNDIGWPRTSLGPRPHPSHGWSLGTRLGYRHTCSMCITEPL